MRLNPVSDCVKLTGGMPLRQQALNMAYITELDDENLLYNFRQEAGLAGLQKLPEVFHRGWEMPTCQLRGHFAGHWLSAAARMVAVTGDERLHARLRYIIGEIAKCQKENGGEWCFTIPEKYLWWIRDGKRVWAPHYTVHKILMGLADAYEFAGIEQALDIADGAAKWFIRYTDGITRERMNEIMESTETGGIMEAWADLYRLSKKPAYLELMHRYEHPLFYERLLAGEDALSNMHANTTIPEILGVCKAYEVTGEQRYYDIAKAYWRLAVDERGFFATGGQTSGEVWTPPHRLVERLSNKNQEHCTVYNMMRLAEFFLRHDGETRYADYWERNLWNGIFAQGYHAPYYRYAQSEDIENATEILCYFLPLEAGAKKRWGSKRDHFWCCHGTLLQANSLMQQECVYYATEGGVVLEQYTPSRATVPATLAGLASDIRIELSQRTEGVSRPEAVTGEIHIDGQEQRFTLRLRIPWWTAGEMVVCDDSGAQIAYKKKDGYACIERVWGDDRLRVEIPKTITAQPLDDRPDCVAFMDGPVVLAGLIDHETELHGDIRNARTMFQPDDERQWGVWNLNWRTIGQRENIRFTPMYNICYERYTTYFPVCS